MNLCYTVRPVSELSLTHFRADRREGTQQCTIRTLDALRERISHARPSAVQSDGTAGSSREGQGSRLPAMTASTPGRSSRAVRHSQVELEAVEAYERSHRDRKPVLDKLRYMRGPEPLPGYDALSARRSSPRSSEADLATIKKVRGYERKFANRPDLLEEVVSVHHRRRETEPAQRRPPKR